MLVPSLENFGAASGLINIGFLEAVYKSVIDETFLDLGRIITIHLPPLQQQDNTTQARPVAQQYNPYFSRTPNPTTNTRNTGTKVTHQDVEYHAHIRIGPLESDQKTGMGNLKENEAMITLDIKALNHVKECLDISIEGRRYSVLETRPIGFTRRSYLMVKLQEIQETENPVPDITVG